MEEIYDTIIIGAGTAGTYLGWLLAKQNYSVLIIDRDQRKSVAHRLELIHFETDQLKKSNLPLDLKPPVLVTRIEEATLISPDTTISLKYRDFQTVVRLPLFLQLMFDLAESEGAKFNFSCKFIEAIYEDKRICGIKAIKENEEIIYKSRIIVDASGTGAAIRTSLPSNYGIETWKLGPNDVMFVPIRYFKWKYPDQPHPYPMINSLSDIAFLNPSFSKDEGVFGVGQPGSFEKANQILDTFIKRMNWPPFELIKKEQGKTPYRRPPYSLVSDGFICIGDAAAITQPFSGHGVTATWYLCRIISQILQTIPKNKRNIEKEDLWDINIQYFTTQGAEYAFLLTILSGFFDFDEKEFNFLFKNLKFLLEPFSPSYSTKTEKQGHFQLKTADLLKIIYIILKGIVSQNLNIKHLMKILKLKKLASKIKKHYENYPKTPADFAIWSNKAEMLWNKKEKLNLK
ncbi:MAG: FAD-dependent monooxygenase [Promethearchaeota archaeon]